MVSDVLIVGQGIAGSLLAWELIQQGKRVCVVDHNHQQSSSIISAGLINPITGQRLVLTEGIDVFYPQLLTTYRALEQSFSQRFFVEKPIIRFFKDENERSRIHLLQGRPDGCVFVKAIYPTGFWGEGFIDPYGSVEFNCTGHCYPGALLGTLRSFIHDKGMLANQRFSYDDIQIASTGISYQGEKFQHVVFCEGFQGAKNPWFSWLKFNNVKGDILRLSLDLSISNQRIITQSQWCVPQEDGTWLAGSTYDREHIDTIPTDLARDQILASLNKIIRGPKTVLSHQAGVRPAMIDQTPVLGFHPRFPRVGIFNGLGSKGFLLAPTYAKMMAETILHSIEISGKVILNRFIF